MKTVCGLSDIALFMVQQRRHTDVIVVDGRDGGSENKGNDPSLLKRVGEERASECGAS